MRSGRAVSVSTLHRRLQQAPGTRHLLPRLSASSGPRTLAESCKSTAMSISQAVVQKTSYDGWRTPEHLLGQMFQLHHVYQSHRAQQSTSSIQGHTDLLERFSKQLKGWEHWPDLSCQDRESLQQAAAELVDSSGSTLYWFPNWGCALLALSNTDPDGVHLGAHLGQSTLYLVAADDWRHHVRMSPGAADQGSLSVDGSLCHAGEVSTEVVPALLTAIWANLQKRLKDKKSKEPKGYGFNYTPGLVLTACHDALLEMAQAGDKEVFTLPRPGFTDVGQHTGCPPRLTSWPLAREVFKALLQLRYACSPGQHPQQLSQQAMAHYELWLLQQQLPHMSAATADAAMLTSCMQMLQSAADKAVDLQMQGFNVSAFEGAAAAARRHLEQVAAQRELLVASRYQLPQEELEGAAAADLWRLPEGVLPAPIQPCVHAGGLEAAMERASTNLGTMKVLQGRHGLNLVQVLPILLSQLQRAQAAGVATAGGAVQVQLALRAVEQELFSRAVSGFDQPSNVVVNQLPLGNFQQLEEMVNAYRQLSEQFRASSAGKAVLQVKLHSRQILVTWIQYCLMYQAARQHAVVAQYGVALQWQDLQHLVLSDKQAMDAALAVAAYLQQHHKPAKELFSLRDNGAATFQMSDEYAAADSTLQQLLADEQAAAEVRQSTHWNKVRQQQAKARRLRPLLSDARADLARCQLRCSTDCSCTWKNRYRLTCSACSSRDSAKSLVTKLEGDLKTAEAPPPPLIQPLPKEQSAAQRWLFFLHMPQQMRCLSRATFLAQQQLLPRPVGDEASELVAVAAFNTSMVEHYDKFQRGTYGVSSSTRAGCDGAVSLHSHDEPPSVDNIKLSHIDQYTSRSHGVWHPDDLQLSMGWKGSNAAADATCGLPDSYFNPFVSIPAKLLKDTFTEQLPDADRQLQWALWQPGQLEDVPSERSNQGIADRCDKPRWLSHPAWLTFTALRAYPLQQLQKLCAALRQRQLPWGHPAVRTLVQQLLYQLGPLTDVPAAPSAAKAATSLSGSNTCPPRQLARTDWEAPGRELDTLCRELAALAEQLQEAPRQHDAVLLLGEVAAYLADYSASAFAVARRFAAMTAAAADELQLQIDEAGHQSQGASQLQSKQCKSRMTALLCLGAGPLGVDEVQQLLQLLVQVKHADLYMPDPWLAAELSQLRVRCRAAIARQLPQVQAVLQEAAVQNQVLTAAVTAVIERAPGDLEWQQLHHYSSPALATGSYQALGSVGGTQHLYSINILDGTVLLDGLPLGRLPRDILDHPLYRRTFGSSNFEVQRTASGVLQTLKPLDSKLYDFFLAADGQLLVEEVEVLLDKEGRTSTGRRLQLLDPGPDLECGEWGKELPVRLRRMHSHWLDRHREVLLLRPRHFQRDQLEYVILVNRSSNNGSSTSARCAHQCWKVPRFLSSKGWPQLLDQHHVELTGTHLVLSVDPASDPVLSVLAKFEEPQYIHVYSSGNSNCTQQHELLFELPRFGLQFKMHQRQLWSVDHAGYTLAGCQQLVNFPSGLSTAAGAALASAVAVIRAADGRDPQPMQLNTASPVSTGDPCPQDASSAAGCVQGAKQVIGKVSTAAATSYTLPGFTQYLVLQKHQPGSSSPSLTVLMPAGLVTSGQVGSVGSLATKARLQMSNDCAAHIKVYQYEVHPRFHHLVAPDVPERLQLAALYAATASLLPEPVSRLNGAQTALQLLRQCWQNGRLSDEQQQVQSQMSAQLEQVGTLGGHLLPALHIMVQHLKTSSSYLTQYVYCPSQDAEQQLDLLQLPLTAVDSYLMQRKRQLPGGFTFNPNQQLTAGEEEVVLQVRGLPPGASQTTPLWRRHPKLHEPLTVPACPVKADKVQRHEQELCRMVMCKGRHASAAQPYPLGPVGLGEGGKVLWLEEAMHQELQGSWDLHQKNHKHRTVDPKAWRRIPPMLEEVSKLRTTAESYLLGHLPAAPDAAGLPAPAWRLLQQAGLAPQPSMAQLLPAAWNKAHLLQYNPLLSQAALKSLHDGLMTWLQLCVLEDRLQRLVLWLEKHEAGADCTAELVKELTVHRTWDPHQHPRWLVFEVEGRLQIRPLQHTIAQTLIGNPGAIVQLNMGEGKTRVILPMLALHWADGHHVPSLNILSTLLPEAYRHLHRHLTASALATKLFLLPFNRDVPLSAQGIRAMLATLRKCQRERGLLLLAPEHRNSLYLKSQELALAGDTEACGLLQQLAGQALVHLVDESDELLHYRYQLVYAVGDVSVLPSREERVAAVQALLLGLKRLVDDGAGCPELTQPGVARCSPRSERPPGSFPGLQLLSGQPLAAALGPLQQRLLQEVLRDPPYEMSWLSQLGLQHKAALERVVLDPAADGNLQQLGLQPNQAHQVLALRGLLAAQVLNHVLQKRHLVNHGVNRGEGNTARKRLAVPFRAANTPAQRTEFSHPDVALVATHLAYYADGLTLDQLHEALQVLLGLEPNAQRALYGLWLELARPHLTPGVLGMVDDVMKLDPTNAHLMATLHQNFSHNMETVNLWLKFCVLPSDTQQYPQRLATSAWHLAHSPTKYVVGFSGTKDTHRLLPGTVKQQLLPEPELAGTDGRMLAMLLDPLVAAAYTTLPAAAEGQPGWQVVLDAALSGGCQVLLDCGALLAEADHRRIVEYLLPLLSKASSSFQGACVYDPACKDFIVVTLAGAEAQQHASPIKPAQCFTVYDEARCRGTDLKLAVTAKAMLTLGPGCSKDKLMQAAGRLRQLGPGRQTLLLAGQAEVTGKVLEVVAAAGGSQLYPGGRSSSSSSSNRNKEISQRASKQQRVAEADSGPCANSGGEPSMTQVLNWVMANTVQDNLNGVAAWVSNGLHYHSTYGQPARSLLPELLELEHFYGSSKAAVPAERVLAAQLQKATEGLGASAAAELLQQLRMVVQQGTLLAAGHLVVAGRGADEECERELQKEEEQEEEQEVQLARATAAAEADWDYSCLLTANSPQQLLTVQSAKLCQVPVSIWPLQQLAWQLHPAGLGAIPWCSDVYVTHNFHSTITNVTGVSEYLRPLVHLLRFPEGQVLLLSDREADAVLKLAWGTQRSVSAQVTVPARPLQLMVLAFADPGSVNAHSGHQAAAAAAAGQPLTVNVVSGRSPGSGLTVDQLVSLQLFDGTTMYSSREQRRQLLQMVRGRKEVVEALLVLRGKLPQLSRSHLEEAADERISTQRLLR